METDRGGPDLSDIGVPRPAGGVGPGMGGTAGGNAKNLELALLDPDAEIAIANRSIRAVTKDGTALTVLLAGLDVAFHPFVVCPADGVMNVLQLGNCRR